VLASASAQDAVFLVGSTHKATFALNAGNTCEWNVYKVNEFTATKDATPADNDKLNEDDDFLFVGEENKTASIDITWKNPGKYYLIVEEFNGVGGCSTRRAFAIQVAGNATIAFADNTSNDCSDKGSSFTTNLLIETDGIANVKFFPISVYYSIGGVPATNPATVDQDGAIKITGLTINDEYSDSNHIISINSAKDKYGGDLNIISSGNANIHTRTLYGIPEISTVTIK